MTELAPIVSYLFVMSITPGPNNLMLTASGVNFGFSRTLPHMLGIVVGLTIQIYLTALGLGVLFTEIPIVRDGLKVVGVAYLLWMSWKIVGAQVANATEGARPLRAYEAMAFQFVNPQGMDHDDDVDDAVSAGRHPTTMGRVEPRCNPGFGAFPMHFCVGSIR